MWPASPHEEAHEFLIVHAVVSAATKTTPWLRLAAQLVNTPLLYKLQFEASTATAMGLPANADSNDAQLPAATSVKPVILYVPFYL